MRIAIHRSAVAMLTLLGACGLSAAVADSPPSPAAADAAAATATTPAVSPPDTSATQNAADTATASAKPAESVAKATEAAQEKALLNAGYRPEMQHGQKVWCRREEVLGSRTEARKVCGTPDQLNFVQRQTQQDISDAQKKLNTYPGH